MNRGLRDVLTALDGEYLISQNEDDEIVLTRADYDYAVMLRTSFYDKRTLNKYWDVMKVIKIIRHGTNQYAAVLDIEQFCSILGVPHRARPRTIKERREAACVISE